MNKPSDFAKFVNRTTQSIMEHSGVGRHAALEMVLSLSEAGAYDLDPAFIADIRDKLRIKPKPL